MQAREMAKTAKGQTDSDAFSMGFSDDKSVEPAVADPEGTWPEQTSNS